MIPKILKGDDTNANGKSIAITYPAGQYIGLSLEFVFLGHTFKSETLSSKGGTFTVDFTAAQTKVMPLGTHFATMALIDAAGKRYTLTNTLKVMVTDDVTVAYGGEHNNISLDIEVTGGIPDLTDVTTNPATPNALMEAFKTLVDKLSAARPTTAAVAFLAAFLCIGGTQGAGVVQQKAVSGDVKFTDSVVTNVSFDFTGVLMENQQMLTNSAAFRGAVTSLAPTVDGMAQIATNAAMAVTASAAVTNAGAVCFTTNALLEKMGVMPKNPKVGQFVAVPTVTTLTPYSSDAAEIQNYKAYFWIGSTMYTVYADVGHLVSSSLEATDDLVFIDIKKVTKDPDETQVGSVQTNRWAFGRRVSGGQYIHGNYFNYGYLSASGAPQNYILWAGPSGQSINRICPSFNIYTNGFGGLSYRVKLYAMSGEVETIAETGDNYSYDLEYNSGEYNYIDGVEADPSNPIEQMSAIMLNTPIGLYYTVHNLRNANISIFANDAGYAKESEWGIRYGLFETNFVYNSVTNYVRVYAPEKTAGQENYDGYNCYIQHNYKEGWNEYSDTYHIVNGGTVTFRNGITAYCTSYYGIDRVEFNKPIAGGSEEVAYINVLTFQPTSDWTLQYVGTQYEKSRDTFYKHFTDAGAHKSLFDAKVPTSRTVAGKPLTGNVTLGTLTINGQTYNGSADKTITIQAGADTNAIKTIINDEVNGTNTLIHGTVHNNGYVNNYITDYGIYAPRGTIAGNATRGGGGFGVWYEVNGSKYIRNLISWSGGTSYYFQGTSQDTQKLSGSYSYSDGSTTYMGTATMKSAGTRPGIRVTTGVTSDLIPDGSDFATMNKLATYATKSEITNVVNEVKAEFYDEPLSVNWTVKMVNGEMKLYATTNVDMSVLSSGGTPRYTQWSTDNLPSEETWAAQPYYDEGIDLWNWDYEGGSAMSEEGGADATTLTFGYGAGFTTTRSVIR